MSKPTVRIHNLETDEIVDREMTDDEFNEWQQEVADAEAKREIEAQKLAAKAALLEKLGITQEEATLLLS